MRLGVVRGEGKRLCFVVGCWQDEGASFLGADEWVARQGAGQRAACVSVSRVEVGAGMEAGAREEPHVWRGTGTDEE
jgi:hypothetical protein